MSVARCQAEVDSEGFAEWMADYSIERWDHKDDQRAALICRAIVNHSFSPPKTAAQIRDFMPQTPEERKVAGFQPAAEMKANWEQAVKNWPKPKKRKRITRRKPRP